MKNQPWNNFFYPFIVFLQINFLYKVARDCKLAAKTATITLQYETVDTDISKMLLPSKSP